METSVPISEGLALIAGPNNAGKTSVIDAIRAVLLPFSERQGDRWVGPSDFTRSGGVGLEVPAPVEIVLDIQGIEPENAGQLISILAPTSGPGAGRLTLRSELAGNGRSKTRYLGGDLGQNDVESIAKEALRFVYLPALRDAESDLRPGLSNRLSSLISAFAPAGHSDREELVRIISEANEALGQVGAVKQSAAAVQSRMGDITGSGPYQQASHLAFSEARYERIIGNLQAMLGGQTPTQLAENGLGYNNLLYVAVVLAAIESDDTVPLTVVLIEEPEAHLHPQLQSRLLEYLKNLTSSKIQVIVTTHSPQFASSAELHRLTILAKTSGTLSSQARHLGELSATKKEVDHLGRFLDVTKSALLFAEAIVLVEGIAEQLIMPELASRLGLSLSERGVQVVSVDGLAFTPFVKLFGPTGLPGKCAIVSDSDPRIDKNGNEIPVSAVAESLKEHESAQHKVELAQKTFEWDLAYANFDSKDLILSALKEVRPLVGKEVENKAFATAVEFADEILTRVEDHKGRFAQELASVLSSRPTVKFVVPGYLESALRWITDGR